MVTPAFAHDAATVAGGEFGWNFAPWIVVPLLVVGGLYLAGSARLGKRSRKDRYLAAGLFWTGFAALALALLSPIHAYGTRIFAVHMAEHEILMVVAVPLMVAARPAGVLLWGMPAAVRSAVLGVGRNSIASRLWAGLTELTSATFLHAAVLWLWHVPFFFEAAVEHEGVHVVQHLSFVLSALFFWTAVLDRDHRNYGQGAAALALFGTSMQAALLGALLTFSPTIWYPNGPDPFDICGLTRAEDQALAGLIMWVPACSLYVVAALVVLARWFARMDARRA